MAEAQTEANRLVRCLGRFMSAELHQHLGLGGGHSTHEARLEHYEKFLEALNLNLDTVIAQLQEKVPSFDMKATTYQDKGTLLVGDLKALTQALRSKHSFSAASTNSIPKCLRALLTAKEKGHNIDAAVEQFKETIKQNKKKAEASANGGNGAAPTGNTMQTDEPVVHEPADEAPSARKRQKSELDAAKQALDQKLREMLQSVQNTEGCDASDFHAIMQEYNRATLAFKSQAPSGAFPSAEPDKVPEVAAKAGDAKGASTLTKPLAQTDGAGETATGKKRKQDDQASKKEAPAAADAAKASNKKSKTADAVHKLHIAAAGKTLAASATSSHDKKAAAKKDEEARKKKQAERMEKEKKERVEKEKAAKETEEKERMEKEEKERVEKEKAAKETEEKERMEKEKAAKEKAAAAAAEKRAADAAKKDDDKRTSLQAKKKSPAAAPASKGSHVGEPGKVPAFADDKWHADVKAQLALLEKKGKLKEATLEQGTLKELKALPYEVTLVCLTKVMNETNTIRDIDAFLVKNCTHLRNQWGLDDAASSSSDDDSSDDESEGEEEASPPAAAQPAAGKVDSDYEYDSDVSDRAGTQALETLVRGKPGDF